MVDRSEIKDFLTDQSGNTKESALANLTFWLISQDVPTDKIGKVIMDVRSYKEWTWG